MIATEADWLPRSTWSLTASLYPLRRPGGDVLIAQFLIKSFQATAVQAANDADAVIPSHPTR
jgi:hypothetical protein